MQFSAMLLHTRQGPVPHYSQPRLTNFHRVGLAGFPGRAFRQQQFHGIRQRRQCVVTKAKDLNSGWQLRETDPLQKAPVGSAIVVGAGVAGLVSALGLAKFGMQVDVFDKDTIGGDADTAAVRIVLSNQCLLALRSVGCNLNGDKFGSQILSTSEVRGMDSVEGVPQRATLPEQLFTTYGNLKSFILHEIERLVGDRVRYHSHYTLEGIEQVDTATRAITFLKGGGDEGKETWKYDLLVGAEGPLSVIRKVLVKSDKKMKSQLSYIGPMRYVSARSLPVENSTASQAFQRLTSPPDSTVAQSPSGGLQVTAKPATVASPVEIAGQPKPEWGPAQDFRIRLFAFQDPSNTGTYCASLQGTPEFFGELAEVLEKGGTQAIRDTLHVLFTDHLPQTWLDELAAAVAADPSGYSAGANVLTSRVSTPAAPAVVIAGDAACATTWRLGYSLETAIDGAIALSDSLFKSTNLGEALESLNAADKIAEANALARIDRVAPAFTGEDVPMGPLKAVITMALLMRSSLRTLMTYLGLHQFAPHASYARALARGVPAKDVYSRLLRETAIVTAAMFGMVVSFFRVCMDLYVKNKYVFA